MYILPIIFLKGQVGIGHFLPHFHRNRIISFLKTLPSHLHVLQFSSVLEIFVLCLSLEGPFTVPSNETEGLAVL